MCLHRVSERAITRNGDNSQLLVVAPAYRQTPMAHSSLTTPGMASAAPLKIRAAVIARVHTVLALSAFFSALVVGCALHYKKIVKNGVAGYPQEWFPSVSAT